MKFLDTWIGNDRAWCKAVKADGWGGLIQGAFSGGLAAPLAPEMAAHCESSLRNARQEGLITAAYTNAAPWRTPQFWLDTTVDNIGGELQHLSFIVVDHELMEAGRPTNQDMSTFIGLLKALGKPLIGYSGDWFLGMRAANGFNTRWDNALDGYWYARYDNNPLIGQPTWSMHPRIVGKQYKNSHPVQGKAVDANEFDDVWLGELGHHEEDDMALLFIGRQGEGGGIFSLDGNHINGKRWAAINKAAKAKGIKVEVEKLSADDDFFQDKTTFPSGPPSA